MAAELARARAGHSQELCCAVGKVSACGVCLGKVSACVLSAPKGTLGVVQAEDGAGETPGLVASLGSGCIGEGRDSPVPSHICCPRTLLSGWKRCW